MPVPIILEIVDKFGYPIKQVMLQRRMESGGSSYTTIKLDNLEIIVSEARVKLRQKGGLD